MRVCRPGFLVAISVAAVGLVVRAAFFGVSVTHVPPAMDECITALQSKGMIESKDSVEAQAKLHPYPLLGRFPLLFLGQPYLFPLEAYLNAPFVGWLPRNAFGIRLMPALLGLLALLLSLLTLRAWGPWRDIWPGALLLLLPSAYQVMIQAGYAPPGYASFLFLSALVLYLAQRYRDASGWLPVRAVALGFCAGLAVASQSLALPMLMVAAAMVLVGRPWRTTRMAFPLFLAGAAVGFLPYVAAKIIHPGAHEVVSGVRSAAESVGRVWPLILNYTLPTAMGFRCTLFPDSENRLDVLPGADVVFPYLWLAVAGAAAALSAWRIGRALFRERRLAFGAGDAFVAVAWIGLLLFAASSRAFSHSFRYLLGVVWAFPFLIAHLYLAAGRRARVVLGGLAVACALLNLATGCALIRVWAGAGFAAREPHIYDLAPAIAYLRERGISRCYANYFDTYRINYMTDERILCSQHYNFRFRWWPLPYKAVVDASTNVAYVLGPAYRFPPAEFEEALDAMSVTCTKTVCGDATVYTDFVDRRGAPEERIPAAWLTASAACRSEDASRVIDDDLTTRWWSRKTQEPGLWVSLRLREPRPVSRLSMYYDSYYHDHAETMDIRVRSGEVWTTVATNVAWNLDHFEMINGHPVYGSIVHGIRFDPIVADEVRIEIREPLPGRDWSFDEARLFSPAAGAVVGPGPERADAE